MNSVTLLCISVLFAVINNVFFNIFKNKGLRGMGDILLFNSLLSGIWIVILLVLNHGKSVPLTAMLWGLLYGILIAAFLLCKMQALSTGPISITSFMGCSSLLISTAFGVLYFKEAVSVIQIAGVIILIFSLLLTLVDFGENSSNRKASKKWYLWSFLFFICSGATGVVFKLHQASPSRNEVNQMMLSAAIVSAVLFLILSVIIQKKATNTLPKIKSTALFYVFSCGIVSCGYNRINISLSRMLPSIVFFPAFNGAVVLLTSLSGAILLDEKLTKKQIFGLIIGMAALIMISGAFNNM